MRSQKPIIGRAVSPVLAGGSIQLPDFCFYGQQTDAELVLTRGPEGAIRCYREPVLLQEITRPLPPFYTVDRKKQAGPRAERRMLAMWADDVPIEAGRTLCLPPDLRELAQIDRCALIVGMGDWFAVWAPGRFKETDQTQPYRPLPPGLLRLFG